MARLESLAAERLDVPHVVAVSSCTSGLMLAARALGLTGEVILPPFTWTASGESLIWQQLEPVFADIEPGRYTLAPDAVRAAITPRTSAIMPVTVFGVPPQIEELEAIAREHDLAVLYDSAQGLGSTYRGTPLGGFGDVEVFSMSPHKGRHRDRGWTRRHPQRRPRRATAPASRLRQGTWGGHRRPGLVGATVRAPRPRGLAHPCRGSTTTSPRARSSHSSTPSASVGFQASRSRSSPKTPPPPGTTSPCSSTARPRG